MDLVTTKAHEKVQKVKEAWEECQKEQVVITTVMKIVAEQVAETARDQIQMRQMQVSCWNSCWILELDLSLILGRVGGGGDDTGTTIGPLEISFISQV